MLSYYCLKLVDYFIITIAIKTSHSTNIIVLIKDVYIEHYFLHYFQRDQTRVQILSVTAPALK